MKLGFHTNGMQNHRLDEALGLIADAGFDAVAVTPDVMHLDPFRATAKEVSAVAARLDQLGLAVVIETGARFALDPRHKHEPTLMSRDRDARARRLDFYGRCARIGRDLGAEVLSFWAGIDHAPAHDSGAWLRDGVEQTCALVRAAGLHPALEPEPGMAVETCAQFAALRDAMGDSVPGLCLDVGHLLATGEGEPEAVIAAFARELLQVHLEDMRRGDHVHLPPGEGDLDFPSVRRALERAGYAGAVCFELSRDSHRAPSMLRRCRAAWGD